jgi:hypothetical protein
MQIFTFVITFDGTGAKQVTLPSWASPSNTCGIFYAEPAASNTHECYVGDANLNIGASTTAHVIKQMAVPASATAILDKYQIDGHVANVIPLAELSYDGTSGEKMLVTAFVV